MEVKMEWTLLHQSAPSKTYITKYTEKAKDTKEKDNAPEIKKQKLGRKAKFKALLLDKNFEPENPTKLENLTDKLCRWPLGERMEPAKFFCGRKFFL